MRNRRYTLRKGPLVIFGENNGISKAFRNLPGVEVASVDSLNLLQVIAHMPGLHGLYYRHVFNVAISLMTPPGAA